MNNPVSTTPTTRDIAQSIAAGSAQFREFAMQDQIASVRAYRLTPLIAFQHGRAAERRQASLCRTPSQNRQFRREPPHLPLSRGTNLVSSAMITSRRLMTATIFSRNSAPPMPLIRLRSSSPISSAPSIVRSIGCRRGRPDQRNTERSRQFRARVGGRNAGEPKSVAIPLTQQPDGVAGGGAGAQSDDHAGFDEGGGFDGGGVLQRVAIHQARTARNTRSQLPEHTFSTSSAVMP